MAQTKEAVYIILVNYNGYEDTVECIESLKKITYSNYKIIVVDNNSLDNSGQKIKQRFCEDIIYIPSDENLGFAGGNNLGIEYALKQNCDYVLLLNNDTLVEPDFLEPLLQVFKEEHSVGAVGGKIFHWSNPELLWFAGAKINSFTGKTRHLGYLEKDMGQYDKITETDYITGCLMLVKREAIEAAGLMEDKYFLYYEETDWNLRIKKSGYRLFYTPNSRIYHKVSASMTKINHIVNYYYDRNVVYFISKNYGTLNKVFVHSYIGIRLRMRNIKAYLNNDKIKMNITKRTLADIKKKNMGKFSE